RYLLGHRRERGLHVTVEALSSDELGVLELLVEDDYGLWEVARRADAVRGVLRKGAAVVVVTSATDDDPVTPGRSGWTIDLEAQSTWAPPEANDPQLLLRATSAGLQAWYRHVGTGDSSTR